MLDALTMETTIRATLTMGMGTRVIETMAIVTLVTEMSAMVIKEMTLSEAMSTIISYFSKYPDTI